MLSSDVYNQIYFPETDILRICMSQELLMTISKCRLLFLKEFRQTG